MESNERYYARRAGEEWRAVERALTPAAKSRHRELAEAFELKARQCDGEVPRLARAVVASGADQRLGG